MNNIELLYFAFVWFVLVPPAAALLSDDIVEEKIGRSLTAWIDRRFRGGLVAYLTRCPRCLSHWVVVVVAVFLVRSWMSLPIEDRALHVAAVPLSILACIRITRGWLKNDSN